MPDITMCKGKLVLETSVHPLCVDCYRRTTKPTPERQSYFTSPPLVEVHDSYACQYYWKEEKWKSK